MSDTVSGFVNEWYSFPDAVLDSDRAFADGEDYIVRGFLTAGCRFLEVTEAVDSYCRKTFSIVGDDIFAAAILILNGEGFGFVSSGGIVCTIRKVYGIIACATIDGWMIWDVTDYRIIACTAIYRDVLSGCICSVGVITYSVTVSTENYNVISCFAVNDWAISPHSHSYRIVACAALDCRPLSLVEYIIVACTGINVCIEAIVDDSIITCAAACGNRSCTQSIVDTVRAAKTDQFDIFRFIIDDVDTADDWL